MGLWEGLWLIARGVYTIAKVVVTAAAAVLAWAVVHPVAAMLIGAGLIGISLLLDAQPWAGSDVVASFFRGAGEIIFGTGIGAWLGQQILLKLKVMGKKVLDFLGYLLRIPSLKASPLVGLFSGPLVSFGPPL